jgi:hypothetical protein
LKSIFFGLGQVFDKVRPIGTIKKYPINLDNLTRQPLLEEAIFATIRLRFGIKNKVQLSFEYD